MMKLKIKSGDTVRVMAGDHKGEEGKIVTIFSSKNRAIVEGVNMISKHTKPSAQSPQGGIVKKEASIHISNLMLIENGTAVKVGFRTEGDKKVRFSKKSDKAI
ncbi:50S ribosomal protein L24 [Lutibacter sp.]|uniref:50S ribosomal protein L24 n=1 Tax=Lutibacter sp. TaxID=1925666 RepID=UPI0025C3A2C9|nr:50S ribosomal protein L24 [Lutibacter sp.]